MADPDLQNLFNQISPLKIIDHAYQDLARALSVAMPNFWATSRNTIIYLLLFLLIKRFIEKGVGGLVWVIFYLLLSSILIWRFGWIIIFNTWFEFLSLFSYAATKFLLKKFGIWK